MKEINKLEWKQETHLHVKEKKRHMNLSMKNSSFTAIYSYIGINFYKWGASAQECFPIQFTNSFLPLSGAFLYNPIAETIELKIVTSCHQVLIVQGVDYFHILQI